MHLKGRVTSIVRTSGGISVTVNGRKSDVFHIDNCCLPGILEAEGPDWTGREVEYLDGCLRFLDATPDVPARPSACTP